MPARQPFALALAALWSVSTPLHAAVPPPQAVLEHCAAHTPVLKGWPALHAQCPGLGHALKQLGLQQLMPPEWRTTLQSASLDELAALAHHYAGAPRSPQPNPAVLQDTALALAAPTPPPSEWDRVRAWLSHWSAPLTTFLRQHLGALLHGRNRVQLLHTLLWCLVALLLALALLGVYIGLRTGMLKRRTHRREHSPRAQVRKTTATPSSSPDWGTLGTQPSRILRVLIEALVEAGRLEREQHLTCRELAEQARFDTGAQREEFAQVALLAERERFGPPAVARVPETVLQGIPALYAQCRTVLGRGAPS
ncbi:MAG: hypothetical protein ACP5P4_13510 [Steroidobacteraceae bacterium]